MKTINIDIETRSPVDISKCGNYKYAENFEILLFGYATDGGKVQVIDVINGEKIPDEIIEALDNPKIIKSAFNANFERVCLSHYVGHRLKPQGWHCTMVHAETLGLPASLEKCGEVLKLDKSKMSEGKALIKKFSTPPYSTPEGTEWELFKEYNRRDVETEMAIAKKLEMYPVPEFMWEEYCIDQDINDRGIMIDETLAANAVKISAELQKEEMSEIKSLTGLENPNSVVQLKKWLASKEIYTDSIGKAETEKLIKNTTDPQVKRVLQLRLAMSKTSVKKYETMLNAKCEDGRVRGCFRFYGAVHTGRFSSKLVQFQNLRRNSLETLDTARNLVKENRLDLLEQTYDDVPDVLSQLIRTALIPKHRFVVADFSAIEARVLAWLAGEEWVLNTFRNGGDIYCATAERMFHVPVKKHGINGELRQKGKRATLSCGYGGSVDALKAMGALNDGMKESELKPLVDSWRAANPHIVQFWWDIDTCINICIETFRTYYVGKIGISRDRNFLFITLPSGRKLAYAKPEPGITYMGVTGGKWTKIESYGPKFVENIVQATARDLLMNSMRNIDGIVAHVHDEVIVETEKSVETIINLMTKPPEWAKGLPLVADGYECKYYRKD